MATLDRSEFERVCNRLLDKSLGYPSYYRIDGKPVFSIYDLLTLFRGLGGVDEARAALDWFREQAVAAGWEVYICRECFAGSFARRM